MRQVRSLFAHVVGARIEVPVGLYKTFEAEYTFDAGSGAIHDGHGYEDLRRRFAAVFIAAARGGSVRCGAAPPLLVLAGPMR
jgi:hypothetical protein